MSERKVWFITRPERDPRFHQEALVALQKATKNFTIKWSANRHAHVAYEQALVDENLKREHISNDGSGGRTWAAMLKTFAYIYTNDEGYLVPTKVGQALLEEKAVYMNTRKQILTLQIPNAYFLEKGFRPKFDDGFQIRPARFIARLTNQAALDYYLTKEEITYFAMTAKKDDELSKVIDKIVHFRRASENEKDRIHQEIAEQYDHRERSDRAARDFLNAHSDVAHTFMLLCEYTEFVEYIRGQSLRVDPSKSKQFNEELDEWDQRYPFNKRYMISLQRMAENNGLDVNSYKATSYGGLSPATNRGKVAQKVEKLLQSYPVPSTLSISELKSVLSKEFPSRDVVNLASEIHQYSYSQLNNDFVEQYLNQNDNLLFEDQTGAIFKAIGFDLEMRPKPNTSDRTEIEILLKFGDLACGLIDAKNYRTDKFPLSATLVSHMVSEYIPNYEGYDGREIQFFGYVTAGNFSGEKNLIKISQKATTHFPTRIIKGVMLSASVLLGFLDYCLEHELSPDKRVDLFLKAVNNSGYKTIEQLLRAVTK
ncbi:restriction endonuclease [Tumebacillus algifaecis]|uniref:Restriction endonuclease n=1 Tax=Tumebacillus algifaecis TaxID=1214604 RepID=A0A223D0D5_9BACL|nr:AlwI family type II restriction endonuclease [Tumebacillus algifaecis]ASS74796.1 restriction endonuclease [Tumebacillus algifaecis]